MEVQQVVRQSNVCTAQTPVLMNLPVRLRLVGDERTDGVCGAEPGDVRCTEVSPHRLRNRHKCQIGRGFEQDLGSASVALDVPIPFRPPLGQAVSRRHQEATHDHDGSFRKTARSIQLEEGKVGERSDGDDRSPLLDALIEYVQNGPWSRWARGDRLWPIALIVWNRAAGTQSRRRPSRPAGKRDVPAADDVEAVRDVAGSPSTRVVGGGNRNDLDIRPAKKHRQGTQVIGVACKIGV